MKMEIFDKSFKIWKQTHTDTHSKAFVSKGISAFLNNKCNRKVF